MDSWCVYMILCDDSSLYTGITNDIERRMDAHASQRGAKYFRGRSPAALVYLESGHNRSTASKREAAIKKLSRQEKCELLHANTNEVTTKSIQL